jgi:DNA-binding GntR family transcriptional regulator
MLAVRRRGRIYPDGEHAKIVSAELVEAPDYVADALGVARRSLVIRRHRITLRGSTPVSASTSWFSGDLARAAPDLLQCERIRAGTPGYIEQQTGRVIASGRDHVSAAAADAQMADDLNIEIGAPVLAGRNWVRDAEGEVVEFGEYVTPSGQWQAYEYQIG